MWGEDLEFTFRLQACGTRIVFDSDPRFPEMIGNTFNKERARRTNPIVRADCPAGLRPLRRQRFAGCEVTSARSIGRRECLPPRSGAYGYQKDSYLDTMRANALGGMAELRDERGIEVARQWCAYGKPPRARVAAIGALARFAKLKESHRDEIVDFLAPMVDDPEFMVRMRVPGAFEEIGETSAIEPLRRLLDRDLDGRIHRRTQHAIDSLLAGRSRVEEGNRLRSEMDKLREDHRKLKERFDKLEAATRPKI